MTNAVRVTHRTVRGNTVSPEIERAPLLRIVGCAVVDTGNASFMTADVIDDGLNHVRQHTEVGHARDGRAPQIMQPPRWHRIPLLGPRVTDSQIEPVFRL